MVRLNDSERTELQKDNDDIIVNEATALLDTILGQIQGGTVASTNVNTKQKTMRSVKATLNPVKSKKKPNPS